MPPKKMEKRLENLRKEVSSVNMSLKDGLKDMLIWQKKNNEKLIALLTKVQDTKRTDEREEQENKDQDLHEEPKDDESSKDGDEGADSEPLQFSTLSPPPNLKLSTTTMEDRVRGGSSVFPPQSGPNTRPTKLAVVEGEKIQAAVVEPPSPPEPPNTGALVASFRRQVPPEPPNPGAHTECAMSMELGVQVRCLHTDPAPPSSSRSPPASLNYPSDAFLLEKKELRATRILCGLGPVSDLIGLAQLYESPCVKEENMMENGSCKSRGSVSFSGFSPKSRGSWVSRDLAGRNRLDRSGLWGSGLAKGYGPKSNTAISLGSNSMGATPLASSPSSRPDGRKNLGGDRNREPMENQCEASAKKSQAVVADSPTQPVPPKPPQLKPSDAAPHATVTRSISTKPLFVHTRELLIGVVVGILLEKLRVKRIFCKLGQCLTLMGQAHMHFERQCGAYGPVVTKVYREIESKGLAWKLREETISITVIRYKTGGETLSITCGVVSHMVIRYKIVTPDIQHCETPGVCYGDKSLVFITDDWQIVLLLVYLKAYNCGQRLVKDIRSVLVTRNLVHSTLARYNVSMFTCEQTYSGDTYIMEGLSYDWGSNAHCFEELFNLANVKMMSYPSVSIRQRDPGESTIPMLITAVMIYVTGLLIFRHATFQVGSVQVEIGGPMHALAVKVDEYARDMTSGPGSGSALCEEFEVYYFEVGTAEQHAVMFAAGLACGVIKLFCAIYSSFRQRAYDQVGHDVDSQKLPVRIAVGRAGLVGADGPTHLRLNHFVTHSLAQSHEVIMVEEATWEEEVNVRSQSLKLRLEDKSVFQEGGNVRTHVGPNMRLAHQLSKPIMWLDYVRKIGGSKLRMLR